MDFDIALGGCEWKQQLVEVKANHIRSGYQQPELQSKPKERSSMACLYAEPNLQGQIAGYYKFAIWFSATTNKT